MPLCILFSAISNGPELFGVLPGVSALVQCDNSRNYSEAPAAWLLKWAHLLQCGHRFAASDLLETVVLNTNDKTSGLVG